VNLVDNTNQTSNQILEPISNIDLPNTIVNSHAVDSNEQKLQRDSVDTPDNTITSKSVSQSLQEASNQSNLNLLSNLNTDNKTQNDYNNSDLSNTSTSISNSTINDIPTQIQSKSDLENTSNYSSLPNHLPSDRPLEDLSVKDLSEKVQRQSDVFSDVFTNSLSEDYESNQSQEKVSMSESMSDTNISNTSISNTSIEKLQRSSSSLDIGDKKFTSNSDLQSYTSVDIENTKVTDSNLDQSNKLEDISTIDTHNVQRQADNAYESKDTLTANIQKQSDPITVPINVNDPVVTPSNISTELDIQRELLNESVPNKLSNSLDTSINNNENKNIQLESSLESISKSISESISTAELVNIQNQPITNPIDSSISSSILARNDIVVPSDRSDNQVQRQIELSDVVTTNPSTSTEETDSIGMTIDDSSLNPSHILDRDLSRSNEDANRNIIQSDAIALATDNLISRKIDQLDAITSNNLNSSLSQTIDISTNNEEQSVLREDHDESSLDASLSTTDVLNLDKAIQRQVD
ncbi:MAG TPA: hypothetical protein DCZ88_17210, partial [Pseudanabaena sp.]|nr:hypothetical protein [Pseudanabaena sp.]